MTNVKFSGRPFEGSLNNLVDDLFTELPALFRQGFNEPATKGLVPVNFKETAKAYRLEVVAPGFDKADFKVNLDRNLLTISAENKKEVNEENEREIRREYGYRSFKRTFTLDEKIDATQIEASYVNGVLLLNLPKKEEVKPAATTIEIK